ncbi:hypothetical protein ONE63_004727 [Megalurothrips usitatus]|uniref:Uncharacterized protein n=1 Tax=Megalurothrips usitatus TaxID=439358 RepID=A0AAV7X7E1_9NEOP|nr:hypothetical protein ONE63_004727 [Megalurothrips usitatus]
MSSPASSRAPWLLSGALILAFLAVAARGDAAAADADVAADGRDLSRESVFTMASCIVDRAPVYCLERRATRYRVQLVGEQRAWEESRALRSADEDDDAGMRDAEELLDTVLPDDSKEEGPDRTSEYRRLLG